MRILIAYDGSECARAALSDLSLAGLPPDAEVLVLSALDAWLPAEDLSGGLADETLPRLKYIRERVRHGVERQRDVAEEGAGLLRTRFPGWNVHAESCADSPAWAIVKRAEGGEGGVGGKPADLVVVGSHGHGGLKRLVLGSVSHRVVTEVRCSVRVARVRADVASASPFGTSPSAPKIVVGVDGSEDSRAAIDVVAERAWPNGTRVLIAAFGSGEHADPEWYSVWSAYALQGHASVPVDSRSEDIAEKVAETLRQRCRGLSVSTLVKQGDPKYALVKEAAAWADGADCIFVGARGVRRIERFLLGSVSTAVAMNAHCTVEIVRPRREAAAGPPGL